MEAYWRNVDKKNEKKELEIFKTFHVFAHDSDFNKYAPIKL